jgi:alpha-2-macroglobulin
MRRVLLGSLVVLLFTSSMLVARQAPPLRVVSSGPTGEIRQLTEANEVRIVFSEPMVALGRIPSNPSPSWVRIAPAIVGTFRWSGTTILIFTPSPSRPLPHATRYTVSVDATATAISGRQLGARYEFSFTTPTVRMISARWARVNNRFDQPVSLAIELNQRVRAEDLAQHLAVRFEPHEAELPRLTSDERARLEATSPGGAQRFDAKVAAARQVAQRSDPVGVRVATTWDRARFPPSPTLVVLETTSAPSPGAHLRLTLDAAMPSPEGAVRPSAPDSSVVELPRMFFVEGPYCRSQCNPSAFNPVRFTEQLEAANFARALSVFDITDPVRTQPQTKGAPSTPRRGDFSTVHAIEEAGFERQPPARRFALHLSADLTATDGQTLGYPFVGIVSNWHQPAFTSFGDGHGVWEVDGGVQLPFYSRNFTTVQQRLASVASDQLMPRTLALRDTEPRPVPPVAPTTRRLNVTADATQSHGVDLTALLSPGGTGLVWAAMSPGTAIADAEVTRHVSSTLVQVTNLGIAVKDSPQGTLVFVTRLDNGEPVPDAQISIINKENRSLWRGPTDRDGIAMAPALPLRKPDDWYDLSFLVTAQKGDDIAYVASDWNEGISPWEFGTSFTLWESTDILRGSVFTDRGVYRPGEQVHVKAIVRADTPTGIRLLPANAPLDVRVYDARDKEIDRRTVTVNRWSSAEWTWTVPAESTLGDYRIETFIPGSKRPEGNDTEEREANGDWLKQVTGSFLVAAYRKPDFRVDATLTGAPAIAGGSMNAVVSAKYLFGSVLGKRPVKWTLTRQPDMSVPTAIVEKFPEDRFAFGYYPESGRRLESQVASEDATLDAEGRLALTLPSDKDVDFGYRYTFEGDVEDVSRQHIANRASIVVPAAPWHIGLRRPAYFADTRTGTNVDVIVAGPDGRPVEGVDVTLSLVRVQWNSIRRAEGSGFYTWDTERIEVPSGEWTVRSAATPVAQQIPVPAGGSYILIAKAKDAEGHRTRTDVHFYGLGSGYTAWERYDHNRITLEPEKKTWKPGETARVMIQSPWESATALLTVEREGIRQHKRFALTSTQQTVEVPITDADIPNVFVSVLLLRGRTSKDPGDDGSDPGKPAIRLGYTELEVADDSKQLGVTVSADRQEYRPANTAKVSVAVKDAAGQPAASEVTLWAVDYGVLSLTDYRAPDVRRAVYQHKALQVLNTDNRLRLISRRVLTPKGGDEGGGGGEAGDVRRDFRPLAFWLGSVETDRDGKATKDITLPESLTTYRIMAVAGDTSSRFGLADAEIRVSKPVTMLAAFPRFLVIGDRATFGATVSNTLTTGGNATVTIRSLDANLLEVGATTSQVVRLDAGASVPVRFDAVARGLGSARLRMTVAMNGNTDAFETSLPIGAPARMETSAAFGDTDSRSVERLAIPAGVMSTTGGLQVDLASTALVGLGEGARYLADYPYGCAEQKASSALALSLAADLGGAFSMGRIAPADYRAKATSLLNDLPKYQCDDGGFGYWAGRCHFGSFYLTSYVLHVMHVAEGLGVAPDKAVVNRALDFLDAQIRAKQPTQVQWLPAWSASMAFAAKVLAEHGRPQDSNITRLYAIVDRLPIFGLSYLADAMAENKTRGPRYDEVIRRLTNALRVEGERAHVEEVDSDALRWLWNSNTRATALVLDGFVRRGDNAQVVPGLVRWLLQAREGGRWRNTQENATALEALVSYYKKYEAEVPNMTARVTLGARSIGNETFRTRTSVARPVALAMPDVLRQVAAGADAELAIERSGVGRLFYAARMQYVPSVPPPPSDQGLRVERRYEKFVENGESPAATSFAAGDLIRVTLALTLPQERRYVAVTDALPGGVEAVDGWFRTTAADLARDASSQPSDGSFEEQWRRGGFDRVEKYDDRVVLFATRLSNGRHEFSYLVRATTAGTFSAAGTWAEEMYAPEVNGRSAPSRIEIK